MTSSSTTLTPPSSASLFPPWVDGNHLTIFGDQVGVIEILPDPHLGRKFLSDVPLHRRGDREKFVWDDFERRLMGTSPEHYTRQLAGKIPAFLHVTLGDLFDKTIVPYDVILRAADIYLAAATARDIRFVILAGNHDLNRELSTVINDQGEEVSVIKPSAFDVFKRLVAYEKRIICVRDEAHAIRENGVALGFVPWSPTKTAEEMVSELPGPMICNVVFGHWDLSGDTPNLLPAYGLGRRAGVVVTGHDHKRRMESRRVNISSTIEPVMATTTVLVAGSMQPYAHGEDDGTMYRTCTLDTIPEDSRELCLRIQLRPGEVPPTDIDAFAVQFRRIEEGEQDTLPAIEDQNFNVRSLLQDALSRRSVGEDVRNRIIGEFDARGSG